MAAVDTLTIKGYAVTVPVGTAADGFAPTVILKLFQPGSIFVFAMANWIASPGAGATSAYLRTVCDGVLGPEVGISMPDQFSRSATAIGRYDFGAGDHFISFQHRLVGGARTLGTTGIFAIGLQR